MRAPQLAAGIIVSILAADVVLVWQGRESVSEWYARQVTRPRTGVPMIAAHVYLVAHLHGRPRTFSRFDPLSRAAHGIRCYTTRRAP